MINRASIDTYFEDHTMGAAWTSYPEEARDSAIAHARKVLARALGRAMNDNEPAYVEGNTYREEYAVAEQALFLLMNGRVTSPTSVSPYPVGMPDQVPNPQNAVDEKPRNKQLYADEALRWLGGSGVAVVKG